MFVYGGGAGSSDGKSGKIGKESFECMNGETVVVVAGLGRGGRMEVHVCGGRWRDKEEGGISGGKGMVMWRGKREIA